MAITPTASTSTLRVISVGTGKDYATLGAAFSYLNSYDIGADGRQHLLEVYEDQTASGLSMIPKNPTVSAYVTVQPVPGAGVNDLENSGPLTYGASGVQLTFATGNSAYFGDGMVLQGFRILVNGNTATDSPAVKFSHYSQTTPNTSGMEHWRKNRIKLVGVLNSSAFDVGNSGGFGYLEDNLIVFDAATTGSLISAPYMITCTLRRNTFVRPSGGSGHAINALGAGEFFDNVFAGMGASAVGAMNNFTGTSSHNYSDNSADSGVAGFTAAAAGSLLADYAADFRPAAGGPLIGNASSESVNTNDIRGLGRGGSPDVGAAQLNPVAAVQPPTGTITSVTQVGQTVTVNFSTTNTPTSAVATLDPAATPNGAVSDTGTVTFGTNTGTATFRSAKPGDYVIDITVTNAGGSNAVSGTTAFTVVDNTPPANPTPSTSGFRVVRVGSGLDYADLGAFATYLGTQNLVSNGEILCAEVYEDQVITGKGFFPGAFDANHYCIIRAVPGRSVNDLEKSAITYGASGIEITASTSSYASIGAGVLLTGLRIHITGSGTGDSQAIMVRNSTNSAHTGVPQGFQYCRFLIESVNAKAIDVGNNSASGQLYDSLMVFGASSPAVGINNNSSPALNIERNTFVRLGTAGHAISSMGSGTLINNAFVNMGGAATGTLTGTTVSNNISDNAGDNGVTGFTVATAGTLVADPVNDFRPYAGGALIGQASTSAQAIYDLIGNNRGSVPDVGALQLNPSVPLPTGRVTSQPAPDGQNLTIQFSTTGSPTSGMATLSPDTTNPAGAITTTGTVTLDNTANTGAASFTNIPPGNYLAPTITLTNSGGPGSVSGTQAVSILGISGTPQAPMADSVPPTMTGSISANNITTSGFTLSWLAATDDIGVAGYEYSLDAGTTWTANGTSLSVTISGKPSDTTYSVQVRAFDAAGNRATPLTGIVSTAAIVPDTTAPTLTGQITVSGITSNGVTFSWPAATDNVGVTGYEYSLDAGSTWTANGTATSRTVTNLLPLTAYQIAVRAFDAAGNRSASLTASVTTLAVPVVPQVPSAPGSVTATATVGGAVVGFAQPISAGGTPITSYRVTASTGQTLTVQASPAVFTLPAGTPVSFTVQAINAAGPSAPSTPSNTVTPLAAGSISANYYTSDPAPRERTILL